MVGGVHVTRAIVGRSGGGRVEAGESEGGGRVKGG